MASFRTHISFGIALGALSAITLAGSTSAPEPSLLITVFLATTLGSVLPDMDSDSGIPFHVAFGSLSIITASLVFQHLYKQHIHNTKEIIAWTLGSALFIWSVIGFIFQRFTRHRGITHSLPAALLAGLVTFFASAHLYNSDGTDFIIALAMTAGFLLHLVLDEIYAALNFNGTPFIPNKAFGSALKLTSDSKLTTSSIYTAILILMAGNTKHFIELGKSFWNTIHK